MVVVGVVKSLIQIQSVQPKSGFVKTVQKKGHTSRVCRLNKKSLNNLEINNVDSNALKMTVCFNNNTFLYFKVDSGVAVTQLHVSVYNVKLSDFPL